MAKITQEQMKQFTPKIAKRACQLCGSIKWTVLDDIVAVSVAPYQPGAITIGGGSTPAIQMTCNGCGQILFLDATILGVV